MNVINDPWLFVRYLNNEVKQISVRQAFIDAEKIKGVETPIFHEYKCQIYNVCTLELLATILKSIYYKPQYKFISGKDIFQDYLFNNWNINDILKYLNKWENRFNLFDNEYPFLQDISLLDEVNKQNDNYISVSNPICPGGKNIVFGKIKTLGPENSTDYSKGYIFNDIELVYILLYTSIMGTSTAASQYPNTGLSSKAANFIFPIGNNLKETLIYNCLPLKTSDRPIDNDDIFYDRPIWELDKGDFEKFDLITITKNTLLCTFFPGIPVLAKKSNNNNIISNMVISKKEVYNKNRKEQLKSDYVKFNPWTINKSIEEKDGNINISYDISVLKIIDLCIALTSNLTNHKFCNILQNNLDKEYNFICDIYYRELDSRYRSYIVTFGEYKISSEILKLLKNDINHEKAVKFQMIVNDSLNLIQYFKHKKNNKNKDTEEEYYLPELYTKTYDKNGNIKYESTSYNKDIQNKFSLYAEEYFFNVFINNIKNENVLYQTANDLTKYMKNLINEIDTHEFIIYAKGYKWFNINLSKIKNKYLKEETDNEI